MKRKWWERRVSPVERHRWGKLLAGLDDLLCRVPPSWLSGELLLDGILLSRHARAKATCKGGGEQRRFGDGMHGFRPYPIKNPKKLFVIS
eukprot:7325743-Pyramimonas_sp.AAC.3